MNIDEAKRAFDELKEEWLRTIDTVETEQDTRFQIIDLLLTKVLGWNRSDIKTEKHTDTGYTDYLVHTEGRARFVIEAKKVSKLLIDTRNPRMSYYQIDGAALKSASDGIAQARNYCIEMGVSYAVLTTGVEWIGFRAIRTDGKPPGEGKAAVFPSLDSISNNFAVFFDLFSKYRILNQLYRVRINEAEGMKIT
jgi:predicted type IV restriction endonuclease